MKTSPVIIVHGGAWKIPQEKTNPTLSGVKLAAAVAYSRLAEGISALEAVEIAIISLENDPHFDAGHGSCLTSTGTVEMDASIMTDAPALGAVACISNVENPISAARGVLDSEHTLLVGSGANKYAHEVCGLQHIDSSKLITDAAKQEWMQYSKYGRVVTDLFNSGHDTVGAVALDCNGRIACGTSTGGITFKQPGRVGDSPLIGAGLYCKRNVGGVSATGHGESIMQSVLCKHLIDLMDMRGSTVDQAAREALQDMRDQTQGCGGVVAIDGSGKWVARCTTSRMAWACVDKDGELQAGIDQDEVQSFGPAGNVKVGRVQPGSG